MATLTNHAKQQIVSRGFDTAEVLGAVDAQTEKIKQLGKRSHEVRVIVKRQQYTVLSDGSNGDLVVACVDSSNMNVMTVMLQNTHQMKAKIRQTPYVG